jgi:hypothetical protein
MIARAAIGAAAREISTRARVSATACERRATDDKIRIDARVAAP